MNSPSLLNTISCPKDLEKFTPEKLLCLCDEIRHFLISSVTDSGGHLASNLGIVEMTIAVSKVFNSPKDRIIFDVGHQCYTYKLITGRRSGFELLRQEGGVSGFPCPQESEYDAFVTGHGNTSLSAAIGIATAKKLTDEPGTVVAIVGDGSFGGGMIYEGMNNIDTLDNLIVILNDNKMSISRNVGSLSKYLSHLRLSSGYFSAKVGALETLKRIPVVGTAVIESIRSVKSVVRQAVYHDTFFEMMGFQYFGPVDGHDISVFCEMLFNAKLLETPVFIHATTQKGRGFAKAECNPRAFHSVSPKNSEEKQTDFSQTFGKALCSLSEKNDKIIAITAAMRDGTGLADFAVKYPKRFFDVGMAEQHAVTFAAGLAVTGLQPVVAIYSCFLQRAYDQILNDVVHNNANVLFAIDRAGLVPADGKTHQGIFDISFLSVVDNATIVSPCNFVELEHWLLSLSELPGIKALRYPRGEESETLSKIPLTGNDYDIYFGDTCAECAVVTFGIMTEEALGAKEILEAEGLLCDVIKLVKVHPLPELLLFDLLKYKNILFVHDTITLGGIGERLLCRLHEAGFTGNFFERGIPTADITHAEVHRLREIYGLSARAIASILRVADGDKT